jgi:hypothetical protein
MNIIAMLIFGPPILLLFAMLWVTHHALIALTTIYKWITK